MKGGGNPAQCIRLLGGIPFASHDIGSGLGADVKNSISFMSRPRKAMSEWVLHCEVNQRHIRRSQPTRNAALKDACSQLLQGHAVNRIVGPNETITAERVRDWCAKHRP
jgi:hypothetical protein